MSNSKEEAEKYYLESSQETFSIHKFMKLGGYTYEEACAATVAIRQKFNSYYTIIRRAS